MKRLIFAATILMTAAVCTVVGQTTRPPQSTAPRPSPTPPAARPAATPAAVSNAPVPESKIALIDTSMFADEKNGIFRYIDAARGVQLEFKPRTDELESIQNRLKTLVAEIQFLRKAAMVDQKSIQAKQSQGEALQNDFTTKKNRLDEDVTKRYELVIAPVSSQIGAAMDQFAKQRGITLTLDASKLLPAILTMVPAMDMTQTFINDFNSKNPRTGPPR